MALKWEGQRVTRALRQAQVEGVNQTIAAAVQTAKRSHAWQNRTGTLEGSIDVVDYAQPGSVQDKVRGVWGSQDVRYALIHELGGTIKAKSAGGLRFRLPGGQFVTVQQVTIPPRPYLRPAADAEYPKLAARIRRNYERLGREAGR